MTRRDKPDGDHVDGRQPFRPGDVLRVRPGGPFAGDIGAAIRVFRGPAGGWFVDFDHGGPPTHAAGKLELARATHNPR